MLPTLVIGLLVGAPLALAAYEMVVVGSRVLGFNSASESRTRAEFDRIRVHEQRLLPAALVTAPDSASPVPRARACPVCAHTVNSTAQMCWRCGTALELLA